MRTPRPTTTTLGLIALVSVAIPTGCAGSLADHTTTGAPDQTIATTQTTPGSSTRAVTFSNTGVHEAWGDPLCDGDQHCLHPFTLTSTDQGDFAGELRSAGAFSLSSDGSYDVVSLDQFTGSVSGCGNGTMLVRSEYRTFASNDGTFHWQIEPGSATGALAGITGTGDGPWTVVPQDQKTYHGSITCTSTP